MPDLSGFQRDLLFVLSGNNRPSGLTTKSQLEDYYESEVNHGRLYPNLDELVDMGLVDKGQKDKRTNYYKLTDHGKQVLGDRREWEDQHYGSAD